MKITICSSAVFNRECGKIKRGLERKGHEAFLYPQEVEVEGRTVSVEEYYRMRHENPTKSLIDIKTGLIWEHLRKIEGSDAILVCNFDKNGIEGYIGGNTFLEIAVAFYLGKKVFVWKGFSEKLPYYEEMAAMNPVVVNKDLERIV